MRFIFVGLFIIFQINGIPQKITGLNFDDRVVDSSDVPVSFDLRNSSVLSPVRSQPTGGCWSSASNATLESWFRKAGCGDFMFSDINLQLFSGFAENRKVNGNHYMATAYYTRQSGPIEKNTETDSVYFRTANVSYLVTDARFLPNNPNLIKQTILNFGPVYSMLYFKKEDTDSTSQVYYTDIEKINHVVSLVGWNDTLPTKKGRGVWLAQNSLGIKYGENGFFYIPFQDKNILKNNAVWTNWIAGNADYDIYYLDTLGTYNSYGFDDTICVGMVDYKAEKNGTLNKVATWVNAGQTSIQIEIYSSFDKEKRILSGRLLTEKVILCKYAGYYTFDLSKRLHFSKNESFFVVMRYSHPFLKKPMPVEQYVKDYCEPHITSGRCWINPDYQKWPSAWYEAGQNSEYDFLSFDLCIRVLFFND